MSEEAVGVKKILVSGGSPTKETAGSIIRFYEQGDRDIEVRAIGAGSVNQMYKAITTARGSFAQKGLDLTIKPGYDTVEINGDTRTVMVAKLIIK